MTTTAVLRAVDVPVSGREAGSMALRIAAVHKTYDQLEAIREVSLDVADGEFVSVLGPSGCGKSTLLMMVAGLVDIIRGGISINGTPVNGPRREIGVVFQSPIAVTVLVFAAAMVVVPQLIGPIRKRIGRSKERAGA